MPHLRLPGPTRQWRGIYPGKYNGNLWQTFNIDLERVPGRICLSNKMRRFDTTDVIYKWLFSDADGASGGKWFGVTGNTLVISAATVPTGAYADYNGTGTDPTDVQDIEIHESASGFDRLVAAGLTTLNLLANGSWTTSWLSLTMASGFHCFAKLQRLLVVSDISDASGVKRAVLHTIDKDDVLRTNRLLFPPGYSVRKIVTTSDRFWIGLAKDRFSPTDNSQGDSLIIEWDGFSLTYNQEHPLKGVAPMTGWAENNIPYFVTTIGQIYRYSGGGFVPDQEFPLEESRSRFSPTFRTADSTGIDPYGATVDGHLVYMNVNAPVVRLVSSAAATGENRRMRSGIWIFNTRTKNLYHHMGIGEHATNGTDVNYGDSPFRIVGGILRAEGTNNSGGSRRMTLASANVYIGGTNWPTTNQAGIYLEEFSDSLDSNAGRNRGYFITTYLPISEVTALWTGAWAKFRRFVDSGNRIIFKWRALDPIKNSDAESTIARYDKPLQIQITWASTTTFTGAVPTGIAVGDEVEILNGDNAGCSFNISVLSATPDGTTSITVTISEAAPTSSTDKALARFDNFKTETAISSTTRGSQHVPWSTRSEGEFIQLKVELRGFAVEIDEILPTYKVNTTIDI